MSAESTVQEGQAAGEEFEQKEKLLKRLAHQDIPETGPIPVPRSLLIQWMAEKAKVPSWKVTYDGLQHARECFSRTLDGRAVEISYKETKYVELLREELRLLRQGKGLGTGEHQFVPFSNGHLRESALKDPQVWLNVKPLFEKIQDHPSELDARLRERQAQSQRREFLGAEVLGAYVGPDWHFRANDNQDLRLAYIDVATQAAPALGCPAGMSLMEFWLESLSEFLAASADPALSPKGNKNGFITDLIAASIRYCSWLLSESREHQYFQHSRSDASSSDFPKLSQSTENQEPGSAVQPEPTGGSQPGPSSEPGEQSVIEDIGSDNPPPDKHPNKLLREEVKAIYEKAVGERLTNSKISELAGYESKSCTELKAWSRGEARTQSADDNIREALQDCKKKAEAAMLNAYRSIEAEQAKRKQQTQKTS
jgi:hypothetical protein